MTEQGIEEHGHNHSHGGAILHSDSLNAYLLELGIASHSIIIGIALGVARDEFISLFIALVFHQFFEGIALSAVVMEAQMKKTAVLMMVIFCKYFFTCSLQWQTLTRNSRLSDDSFGCRDWDCLALFVCGKRDYCSRFPRHARRSRWRHSPLRRSSQHHRSPF